MKPLIDHDAIAEMFKQATAAQGETLRVAVCQVTLKALQGREFTLANTQKVIEAVTAAATSGASQNSGRAADMATLLNKAFSGMDAALLQAVEANRRALQQFVDHGADIQERQLQSALDNLEKMESAFFGSVSKAAESMGGSMSGPWSQVLETMRAKGTHTGARATQAIEQLVAARRAVMQTVGNASAKTMKTLLDSYASLVSGVLLGMSEGLQQGRSDSPSARSAGTNRKA